MLRDFDKGFMVKLYNDMYYKEWVDGSKDYTSLIDPQTWRSYFELYKMEWPDDVDVVDTVMYGTYNSQDTILLCLTAKEWFGQRYFRFYYSNNKWNFDMLSFDVYDLILKNLF